jgi:hypothetical protein
MALISPAGNDSVSRRRNDGSYSVGVTGTAFRSTVTITRPANTTAYTAGDVVGDTGGSAILTLANAGPSGGYIIIQSASLIFSDTAVISGMGSFLPLLLTTLPLTWWQVTGLHMLDTLIWRRQLILAAVFIHR